MGALHTLFQPGDTPPSRRSAARVLFTTERPVESFMEGFVTGGDEPTVAQQLTNQILAQIRDHLALIERKQDSFGVEQQKQSERIVRLEERNERFARLDADLAREKGRVDALMRDKDKRDGAIGLAEWVSKHWPFTLVSGALAAFVAYANGLIGKG